MHTTISTEGRQVGIEFSDAVLHTTGEFCGNLHIPLQFNDPISTKAVLTHLRIKLPDNNDLYDASAHGETVGGLEMIFFRTDDSFLDPFPPDQIPDSIELFWLEDNMPNRLGEVMVKTVAEEPDSETGSVDEPVGGSGCAGVVFAVFCIGSVLLLIWTV
jgi:hypothetical protein